MGDASLSTVRKAAKLAVYEDTIISVKNHHITAIRRVELALKSERFYLVPSDTNFKNEINEVAEYEDKKFIILFHISFHLVGM